MPFPEPLREDLPITPERLIVLDRIIRRGRKIVAEIEALIRDADAWRSFHPDEAHLIDSEQDRVELARQRVALAQAERIRASAK